MIEGMIKDKNPIHELVEEHKGIKLMLRIFGKLAEKLKGGEQVEADHIEKAMDFFRNFADKCHHAKEEGILFPEILRYGSETVIINDLLDEHKAGRDYLQKMEESSKKVVVYAQNYIELLVNHIDKEDTVLFPEADKLLTAGEKSQIQNKFDTLEMEVIGAGKHEEYHGWLAELKEKYIEQKSLS